MPCSSRYPATVRWLGLLLAACVAIGPSVAWGGTARFVSGQGWGVYPGVNVIWKTQNLLYFTDQGPLSPQVDHAQADAMVAAAAAVWSAPTSSISFAQGGNLAEDVSPANMVSNGTEVLFPADVQLANEANMPVAIVYDVDGSIVDLLLGDGASEPDGCRQNAVVGDVDDIHQDDGTLRHATLVLNGRCVSAAPEALTQMQYQLARAFGRVLGLSWSQTNDNVFTAETTVTAHQVQYWPLMHPLDVICGTYSYQCMSDPFTLRVDDLNTLAQLYPVYQAAVPAGKRGTSDDALYLWGNLNFPTGQGMGWVNITTRRLNHEVMEDWETTSAVTGNGYLQATGTPLSPTPAVNAGSSAPGQEGYFVFRRVPLDGSSNVFFTTEPINPLYTGDYAVGPYVRPPATPSGSALTFVDYSALSAGDAAVNGAFTVDDAASSCNPGPDGTETAPATVDASGWQSGLLCGLGHSSWWTVPVSAGHTWTLEVTATDESGVASLNKVQPVLGVWHADDAASTLPTVASQAVPFNSLALGMTRVLVNGASTDESYRISVSDQYGAGRPDFTYVARVLYAAAVAPSTLGSSGGQIVIKGTGFREGNQVLVNGAAAQVISCTATTLVVQAPTMQAAGAQLNVPLTVSVVDASTGGTATIPDALQYVVKPNLLTLVSAPSFLETSVTAATPFAVRVLASDGQTAVAGASVTFNVPQGSAMYPECMAGLCTVLSDASGLAKLTVQGGAAGSVTLGATEAGGGNLQVTLPDTDPVRSVSFSATDLYVAADVQEAWKVLFTAVQHGAPSSAVPVTLTANGLLVSAQSDASTDSNGHAQVSLAGSVAAGTASTVTGCAWTAVCAALQIHGVGAAGWVIHPPLTGTLTTTASASLAPVTFLVTDSSGHPLLGAPVHVYQRVLAWEGLCADQSRCAAAPVLKTSQAVLTSSSAGEISVTPIEVAGVPQVVEIATATGDLGFATLTLTKTP